MRRFKKGENAVLEEGGIGWSLGVPFFRLGCYGLGSKHWVSYIRQKVCSVAIASEIASGM